MTAYTERVHIIIPIAWRAPGRAVAARLDPDGAADVFVPELSLTGTLPATHTWCSWQVRPEDKDRLVNAGAGVPSAVWRVFDAATHTPDQALDAMSLRPISSTAD